MDMAGEETFTLGGLGGVALPSFESHPERVSEWLE